MAIWPFNRKSKRHTIQVTGAEAADLHSFAETAVEPTLGRKKSKRPNNHTSRAETADCRRSLALVRSNRPILSLDRPTSADHPRDPPPRDHLLSRTGSLLRRKPSQNAHVPNKLRRKLSKRKANEIMREREIRMLSSTPIDIPNDNVLENRRRKANGRRADRYLSDISLSIRNSATSSTSDISDPYTYKVNAFAVLTPRPVVHYVEAPRLQTARSGNPPSSSRQERERLQALTTSEEDFYYSKRRVNELADSLDAGALRELLDRDRRRREKKQVDDQERLRRKLQERADAQQAEEQKFQAATHVESEPGPQITQPEPSIAEVSEPEDVVLNEETIAPLVDEPTAVAPRKESWLLQAFKGSENPGRESRESSRVVGNVDDGSIRERRLVQRPSFAPSNDISMSRTTLSPSHSSLRHGINSPAQSQIGGPSSTSDISRGVDSESRLSDTSGRRGNTITSLFRRGSSRLKRTYKERFHDNVLEFSNASHESFYKIQTQTSPPPSIAHPRILMPTGTVKRSQSKFTEHFGDEPLSLPDSRLQSPDIPEEVLESSLERDETFLREPTPSPCVDIKNPNRSYHRSLASEGVDTEADNVPLSQSLASIDSEGSWMSGQFFRRMSQKPCSPAGSNLKFFGQDSVEAPADASEDVESMDEPRRLSSNILEPDLDPEVVDGSDSYPTERWHNEVGRRAVVVNPAFRPISTQGMLRGFPSLTPISAEEDYILEETTPSELQRIPSARAKIGYAQ
ncbi:hypothetical protein PDIG_26080 [Penicillium digitatum PHI26]|uniref:Uncharacterized protein n=2 Tax=Penicillium digitatum TaxID=36651 RepID=K9G3L4_PEND2|nr:hypothetical protein PDIP_60560 [Penicillium digitatum Pd1]EKV10340.1 hypothetical protein PDIP_60560 [Penicillium digitatum Pd1]EKV15487.1 hypothetical protein PDIG_26080 [Penicillium digitatum PHI26]